MNDLYSTKPESYYSNTRQAIVGLIPPGPNKVLELGCAKGYTLFAAKESGRAVEIVGIDILPADSSHSLLDNYILNESDNFDIDYPAEYFDAILYADVLEHLVDPWGTVSKLDKYLKPGGVIIASIPNIRFHKTLSIIFLGGDFHYDDDGAFIDKTHLRFFCKRNMRDMFTRVGLTISRFHCKMSYFYRVINTLTLGLTEEFFVRQYILVARKPGKRQTTNL